MYAAILTGCSSSNIDVVKDSVLMDIDYSLSIGGTVIGILLIAFSLSLKFGLFNKPIERAVHSVFSDSDEQKNETEQQDYLIYDSSFVTSDGFHVGSTSGDIFNKYPNATVHLDEEDGREYIEIDKIHYFFDSESRVGDYSNSDVSKIIDKTIPVWAIHVGDL